MDYYACLFMLSLLIPTPFAIAVEGPQMWAAGWQTCISEIGPNFVCEKMGVSGQSPQLPESLIGEPSSKVHMWPEFDSECLPCLVKIYDSLETDLKLNDIVEFIGVFTFNPKLISEADGSADLSNELFEDTIAHLPPNKRTPNFVRGIREGLLGYLTVVLGNDGLAAECLVASFVQDTC